MRNRLVKLSTLGAALLLTVTLVLVSMDTGTSAAGQLGVPFGIEQLQAQLTTLQAHVEALQPRKFYLTVDGFDGASATTACAAGYHMASLWEIYDPTGLRYDRTLGVTSDDMGQGPRSAERGWVRTGQRARVEGRQGDANCNAYTSNEATHSGSVGSLLEDWETIVSATPPWETIALSCATPRRVWCVQD
jgi:hypothetical protein